MPGTRRYDLLCPIARALDRIGQRWSLLILRDLHAGPARFTDLQVGLPSIASNLLTARLRELEDAGLVRQRTAEFGARVYELTELGERTDEVLAALARFGALFPATEELVKPGNLRLVAVPLQSSLQAVLDPELSLTVELWVDGEPLTIDARESRVRVRIGDRSTAELSVATSYEKMLAVWEGELDVDTFGRKHVEVRRGEPAQVRAFFEWMARAIAGPTYSST